MGEPVELRMKVSKFYMHKFGAAFIVVGFFLLGIHLLTNKNDLSWTLVDYVLIVGGSSLVLLGFYRKELLNMAVFGVVSFVVGILMSTGKETLIVRGFGLIWLVLGGLMIIIVPLSLLRRRRVSKLEKTSPSAIPRVSLPVVIVDEEKIGSLGEIAVAYEEMISFLRKSGIGVKLVGESKTNDMFEEEISEIMIDLKGRNIDRIKITKEREGVERNLYIHHYVYVPRKIDEKQFETNLSWVKTSPTFGKVKDVMWDNSRLGSLLNKDKKLASLLLRVEKESIRRQRDKEAWGFYRRFYETFHLQKRPQIGVYVDSLEVPKVGVQWIVDIVTFWGDILTRQRKVVSEGLYFQELFDALDIIAGHVKAMTRSRTN